MDLKTSQFGTITSIQANAAGVEGYLPYVDPSQVDPDLRNKRMTRSEAKKFFGLDIFTALSGTAWDGTNKTLTLTTNTALTFSSTKRNGILRVKQDGTGGRTLSINTVSVPVSSGANTITVISFFYDDVAGLYVFSYDTNILGNVGGGGGGDTTPPTVVSATATDATHFTVVFSETVVPTAAGWNVQDGTTLINYVPSSVSGSGTTWIFALSSGSMPAGDPLNLSYNSGTGNTVDTSSNEVVSFTGFSMTNSIGGGGSYDTDAAAFFTAASITDTTQKNAVNQLVLDLKAASLWTNMKALYPFVGGTAATHKYNLRDTAQYQITWAGGVTHSANGVDLDGSSGYGNTNAAAGTVAPNSTVSFGSYLREIGALGNSYDLATYSGAGNNGLGFSQNQTGSGFILDNAGNVGIALGVAGLFVLSTDILANGGTLVYNNGTYLGGSGFAEACTSTANYIIGSLSTSFGFSNRQTALAFIYSGVLDASQNSALYTAIQTFETSLSRQV